MATEEVAEAHIVLRSQYVYRRLHHSTLNTTRIAPTPQPPAAVIVRGIDCKALEGTEVEWTPMADIGRGLKNRSDGKKHP
jgi:hypothetical protein